MSPKGSEVFISSKYGQRWNKCSTFALVGVVHAWLALSQRLLQISDPCLSSFIASVTSLEKAGCSMEFDAATG